MIKCSFVRLVKELNHRFKFYAAIDQYSNASIWYNADCHCPSCKDDGHVFVCAVPSTDIPEYSVITKDEFIKDRGWRAVLRIILSKRHNGKPLVDIHRFWKVLHKHGISHIDQAVIYESAWGNFYGKKTSLFTDYHKQQR